MELAGGWAADWEFGCYFHAISRAELSSVSGSFGTKCTKCRNEVGLHEANQTSVGAAESEISAGRKAPAGTVQLHL